MDSFSKIQVQADFGLQEELLSRTDPALLDQVVSTTSATVSLDDVDDVAECEYEFFSKGSSSS